MNATLVFLNTKWQKAVMLTGHEEMASPGINISLPMVDFWFKTTLGTIHQQLAAFFVGAGVIAFFYICMRCTMVGIAFSGILFSNAARRTP